jgi:hypothetical protein
MDARSSCKQPQHWGVDRQAGKNAGTVQAGNSLCCLHRAGSLFWQCVSAQPHASGLP